MQSIIEDLPHPSPQWHCDLYSTTLGVTIEVEEICFHEKTSFQDVKICTTKDFGKILLLNDFIYRAELVHFMVPEMIAHVPMRSGLEKKRVLVIGGGDGYTASELTKYRHLQTIDVVDIDERVIHACRLHFPVAAHAFEDNRVHLTVADGYNFLRRVENQYYDLIMVTGTEGENLDGSPGISHSLFQDYFFMECQRCLSANGMFLIDASTVYFDISTFNYVYLQRHLSKCYKTVKPYILANGALIGGLFAITIASNTCDPQSDISSEYDYINTRYYNRAVHSGAFALPQLMCSKLEGQI